MKTVQAHLYRVMYNEGQRLTSNKSFYVVAASLRNAYESFEDAHPGSKVWSVNHLGKVEHITDEALA